MDDLLLDDEEQAAIDRKKWLYTGIGCTIILLLFVGAYAWDAYKPLPHHDYCTEKGFEAGEEKLGTIICYKDCTTNQVSSCNKMMAVRK